jgi:uncharacterized membrane protein YhdT
MLFPFFQWCDSTAAAGVMKNSPWAFAAVESVHLLGLSVIGGAVLLVNMRLLGLGFRDHPVAEIAHDAYPWLVGALIVMLLSGVPLFLAETTKCYYSFPFWVKMTSLLLSMTFTFTVWRRVIFADEPRVGLVWRRATALVSLALWFGVGGAGRWIGFSG